METGTGDEFLSRGGSTDPRLASSFRRRLPPAITDGEDDDEDGGAGARVTEELWFIEESVSRVPLTPFLCGFWAETEADFTGT